MLILNSLKKCWKNAHKKVITKNVTEICTFFTFIHVRKICFAYNFFGAFFNNFFNGFEINVKFCVFDTFFDFFKKQFYLGHINTFFKLWSLTRKKQLKKSKHIFSECVLDSNFAPIKGSVFFMF